MYQRDFFTDNEKKVFNDFHKLDNPNDKISFVQNLDSGFEREMSIRIVGRNYYDLLPKKLKDEYDLCISKIIENNLPDHLGRHRNTVDKAINNIRKILSNPSKYDDGQHDILKTYESYLLNRN